MLNVTILKSLLDFNATLICEKLHSFDQFFFNWAFSNPYKFLGWAESAWGLSVKLVCNEEFPLYF